MSASTFITNADTRTLKKRLEQLIQHSQELKFLVGFFYFSGWRELYQALKTRDDLTIKLLVGLDVERARLRAELDGLIAQLYNLTEEEFAHILSAFPLVADPVKVAAQNAYRDVERGLIV